MHALLANMLSLFIYLLNMAGHLSLSFCYHLYKYVSKAGIPKDTAPFYHLRRLIALAM